MNFTIWFLTVLTTNVLAQTDLGSDVVNSILSIVLGDLDFHKRNVQNPKLGPAEKVNNIVNQMIKEEENSAVQTLRVRSKPTGQRNVPSQSGVLKHNDRILPLTNFYQNKKKSGYENTSTPGKPLDSTNGINEKSEVNNPRSEIKKSRQPRSVTYPMYEFQPVAGISPVPYVYLRSKAPPKYIPFVIEVTEEPVNIKNPTMHEIKQLKDNIKKQPKTKALTQTLTARGSKKLILTKTQRYLLRRLPKFINRLPSKRPRMAPVKNMAHKLEEKELARIVDDLFRKGKIQDAIPLKKLQSKSNSVKSNLIPNSKNALAFASRSNTPSIAESPIPIRILNNSRKRFVDSRNFAISQMPDEDYPLNFEQVDGYTPSKSRQIYVPVYVNVTQPTPHVEVYANVINQVHIEDTEPPNYNLDYYYASESPQYEEYY